MSELQPAKTRLTRVAYFMRDEKYTAKFTGETKTEKKGAVFPAEVWNVTVAIMASNQDPCLLDRKQTLPWADHIMFGAPVPAVSPVAPQTAPTGATEQLETEGEVTEAPAKPQPAVTAQAAATETTQSAQVVGMSPTLAIYTLLLSSLELTKFDKKSGAEGRAAKLDTLAKEYLTVVQA